MQYLSAINHLPNLSDVNQAAAGPTVSVTRSFNQRGRHGTASVIFEHAAGRSSVNSCP
jgi:hypothetical protein